MKKANDDGKQVQVQYNSGKMRSPSQTMIDVEAAKYEQWS